MYNFRGWPNQDHHHLINFDGDAYQRMNPCQALEITFVEVTKTNKWFKGAQGYFAVIFIECACRT